MNKLLLLLLPLPIILSACMKTVDPIIEEQAKTMVSSPLLVEQSFKDLGVIAMDKGNVTIDFKVKNTGKEPVVIKKMTTSCMCTTAQVEIEGETSSVLGMRAPNDVYMVLAPDKEAIVKATFDPNFHGPSDTGLKRRSIILETNSSINPKVKLDFQLDVIKKAKDLPNRAVFDYSEKEFDFGLIKQSGGVVEHDFILSYNGEEDIEVIGVPTSCACTSAKIDKTQLSKGDKAVITVAFDPNLHEEPVGRFFKTISIVTNPEVEDIDDLKIWAEIDLDLGREAYKLKSEHDDSEDEHEEGEYRSITPAVLDDMLENKDFILVDVHIPEQSHIPGTDISIPYNNIVANIDKLPQDKEQKIVVYCRSGSMSRAAAYSLAELGYSNIYDLVGGKNAYDKFKK